MAEDWLKGVVEARRKVRVPFERGLWQGLARVRLEHGQWGTATVTGGFFQVLGAWFACFAGFLALLALLEWAWLGLADLVSPAQTSCDSTRDSRTGDL